MQAAALSFRILLEIFVRQEMSVPDLDMRGGTMFITNWMYCHSFVELMQLT
jgi:hypothetical protein